MQGDDANVPFRVSSPDALQTSIVRSLRPVINVANEQGQRKPRSGADV